MKQFPSDKTSIGENRFTHLYLILVFILFVITVRPVLTQQVDGSGMRWNRVTISFDGPETCATCEPNPFLRYRLDVTFIGPNGETFRVPGFYAGDGEGGSKGGTWRVRFNPPAVGSWEYTASFRKGKQISVSEEVEDGQGVSFDGASGTFEVVESERSGRDFRRSSRGLLKNRGHHYLTFPDGTPWVKGGPNIPENFLAHSFEAHGGRKEALDYIAQFGVNSIYFLPNNIGGDGDDTWPYIQKYKPEEQAVRFDVEKLRNWEEVFTHAQSKGVFLHFLLAETEDGNEHFHDGGNLGVERKLYYRELIARFGHHNGLQWNIGEENDYGTERRKRFAGWLKKVDPYDHPVTTHTHTNKDDAFYKPLLGNEDIDVTSFQAKWSARKLADRIQLWRERSREAGVPWAVNLDEPQKIENDPDDQSSGYPHGRRHKMWPVYLSGGAGFEWYVQKDGSGHSLDQNIDDYRRMKPALEWTGYALSLLRRLPLNDMAPAHDLGMSTAGGNTYVLRQPGQLYVLYNDQNGSEWKLNLEEASGTFRVGWYDPRNGGELQHGSIDMVNGGDTVRIGSAPGNADRDWVAIVRRNEE